MKNQSELRSNGISILDCELAHVPHFPDSLYREPSDVNALLQLSSITISEFSRRLTASERNLALAQKKMDSLHRANIGLRTELMLVNIKADKAQHLAFHDELTGLANRRLLLDRLTLAIAHAMRQERHVALVFFDIDDFKSINDQYGHAHGDAILQCVAERLRICLRATDTACRYGGDEFIVMLPEIAGEQSAAVVEQKLRAQLAEPYRVNGDLVTANISIGIAVYPDDATDHQDLIRLADQAMYHAKSLRKIA